MLHPHHVATTKNIMYMIQWILNGKFNFKLNACIRSQNKFSVDAQTREKRRKKIYITFCLHICIEGFIKNSFRVMMIKWRTSCWKGNVCYYYGSCCCFFFIIFISKGPCFGLYLDITCVSFGRGSTSQFLCQIKETCLILDNVVIYAQNRYIVDIFFYMMPWCVCLGHDGPKCALTEQSNRKWP